ncbi:Uncharacterised protein [Mycobacteroides abscessus subsp. massiliense]|nr:Uncharacterised protein [Mycobacteroides abscessus subsp. massiliense]
MTTSVPSAAARASATVWLGGEPAGYASIPRSCRAASLPSRTLTCSGTLCSAVDCGGRSGAVPSWCSSPVATMDCGTALY